MPTVLTSSQQTFVDITDQRKLSAYITSNLPKTKSEDPNVLPTHLCTELGKHPSCADPCGIPGSDKHCARLLRPDHHMETEGRHIC